MAENIARSLCQNTNVIFESAGTHVNSENYYRQPDATFILNKELNLELRTTEAISIETKALNEFDFIIAMDSDVKASLCFKFKKIKPLTFDEWDIVDPYMIKRTNTKPYQKAFLELKVRILGFLKNLK